MIDALNKNGVDEMYNIDEVIYGLEFTKAMITFNPSTGEGIEPENLNEDNKITYDACVGAIALLKEQERIIKQYHKADTFLEIHGWKW